MINWTRAAALLPSPSSALQGNANIIVIGRYFTVFYGHQ